VRKFSERILEIQSSERFCFEVTRLRGKHSDLKRKNSGMRCGLQNRQVVITVKGLFDHRPAPQAKKEVATNRHPDLDMSLLVSKLKS
jgi:hypothetical protein